LTQFDTKSYKIPKADGYSSSYAEKSEERSFRNNNEYKLKEIIVEPKRIEISNIKFQTLSHPRDNYKQ
jgi:hypothetical protein